MTKIMRLLFLTVFFCMSAHSAVAQETKVLSLNDCIEIALKNNSTLRNAKRQHLIAKANVVTARSNFLPSISTSFSSGRYVQGARLVKQDVPVDYNPATGKYIYEQRQTYQARTDRNFNQARISLSQEIYDFGRSINDLKQAQASRDASDEDVVSTRQAVVQNVKVAYFELLKAEKLEEVYSDAVKLADEQVDRAKTMMDIGLASQAEVYQAKVNWGTNKRNYITQKNNVEFAKADLNNALGWNPNTSVEIVQETIALVFFEYKFDDAVKIAIENNPQIKSLELSVKSSLYNQRAAKAQYAPSLGASVSYTRSNDEASRVYSTKLNEDYTASLGLQLDLNLFNGMRDKAQIQRETLNYQMAVENLAEQKRQIAAQVKQYFLELEAFKEILDIQKENIDAAKENLRLQREKRRVGSGTELDVSDAQVQLTRAQSDYVQAEHDAQVAKARLETAMGIIK